MVIVAKMTALEGREAEMEKMLTDMVARVSDEPGTLVYTLHKDQNNPRVFLFYEKYKDMEAVSLHSSTPYIKEMFRDLKPLLDGKPEITMYNEIASI